MIKLTKDEMLNIIQKAEDGVLALTDGKLPYCIPFGYVYIDGSLYLSMLPKGRKWKYFNINPHVCFNIYSWTEDNTYWHSVVIDGRMELVADMKVIESVVKANIIKMDLDPVEHLKKRMKYYKDSIDNPKAIKIFKIAIDDMQGKSMKGIIK